MIYETSRTFALKDMKDGIVNVKSLDKTGATLSVFYLTDCQYSDISFQSCHMTTPRNVVSNCV